MSRLGPAIAVAIAAVVLVPAARAATYQVHPPGDARAKRAVPPDWERLQPGDRVVVYGGRYEQSLTLRARGTESRPIVIEAADGEEPVVKGSIVLEDSAHVHLRNITFADSPHPGITLRRGTHDVTVSGCTVRDCAMGIWITDGAGMQNRLFGNHIVRNQTHGIAVDRANAARGRETVIARNRIEGNGIHGIEVNASYYVLEENEVFENGAKVPGTSGIHLYAKDARQDAGDHNVIRRNVTYRNLEARGPDGNGIQLDQWCDDNDVYFNLAFENDGAGISLFDAARNRVVNNTLFGNVRDPGGDHPYRGELTLASDVDRKIDLVRDNVIANNVVVATNRRAYAVYVDALTADNPQAFRHNLYFHRAPNADFFFWRRGGGRDLRTWERGADSRGTDRHADPRFGVSHPARPEDFGLRPDSPGRGASNGVPGLDAVVAGQDLGALGAQAPPSPATGPKRERAGKAGVRKKR